MTLRRCIPVLIVGFVLAIITSIPQIHLWYLRGSEWNGSCALSDHDELPYLAYTNALINGRPRRNDPYGGTDNLPSETLFSIQFIPPYLIALPARVFGISADTAFMLLLPLATVATVWVCWWILFDLTGHHLAAIIGAVAMISVGTVAAHSPFQILQGIETGYTPFPLLRRYIPAFPFPFFMASTYFVWRALTKDVRWAIFAGLSFVVIVFSYFFLWSALMAWTATILVMWFFARPEDRSRTCKVFGLLITIAAATLVPYAVMLMHRSPATDRGQLLELRHTPDLLRAPELYGGLLLLAVLYQVRKRRKVYDHSRILFTLSFAIAPFVVFNQQILTGRSLQPFHYEEFAANYWIVFAAFLAVGLMGQQIHKRIMTYLAIASVGFAIWLATVTARLMAYSNVRLDQVRSVALSLKDKENEGVVFASDRFLTHSISSITNKPVLWARYMYTFSAAAFENQKKRYYQYLYYSGVDESEFIKLMHDDVTAQSEVFGQDRVNPVLTTTYRTIAPEEIQNAAREYQKFTTSFDLNQAANPILSYAVVPPSQNLDHLDQWYERTESERVGEFVIYALKIKSPR